MRNKNLDRVVLHFCTQLQQEFPGIVLESTYDTYEGEDADIDIYVSPEIREGVEERALELTGDILTETDFLLAPFFRNIEEAPKVKAT